MIEKKIVKGLVKLNLPLGDEFFSEFRTMWIGKRAPGKGFEPLSANAQPLSSENDLEAVAVPLG